MNKKGLFVAALLFMVSTPLITSWVPLSFTAPKPSAVFSGNHAFSHQTGKADPAGWGAYFRHHVPGYLINGLRNGGEALPEGMYRYEFYFVRRIGHFTSLFSDANDIIRIEVYDATAREILTERTYQFSDFSSREDQAIRKNLTFTTLGRPHHRIEPRIYWKGLSSLAVQKVTRVNIETPTAEALREKTNFLADRMTSEFLDRGQVIVRRDDGTIVDQADSGLWTGVYAASLALRYKTTQDENALRDLEKTLWTLHRLHRASPLRGTLVRYVKPDGLPLEEAASKDTYTGFFYGVSQSLPYVKDHQLRKALLSDIKTMADTFLAQELTFPSAYGHSVSLSPSLSAPVLREAFAELGNSPRLRRKWITILHATSGYFWLHGQKRPPRFGELIQWIKNNDMSRLELECIPVLNDVRVGIHKLQTNIHRTALRGSREGLTDTPYIKLDLLLLRALTNLDVASQGQPFTTLEEIKIFPSQSILALYFIKAAAEALPKPNAYDAYYHANLFEGKALLRTVLQWHEIDSDLLSAIRGETEASAMRTSSSHLRYLALHHLIQLEKDPLLRFKYQKLFEAQYRLMRTDGNAMIDAMHASVGLSAKQLGVAWWSLGRYPLDRRGKGAAFWAEHREELARSFGGISHGKARDPLPPDLRPRDAFMWQRSARSIYGDEKDWLYPPLDYLFAYWLARSAASLDAVTEKL